MVSSYIGSDMNPCDPKEPIVPSVTVRLSDEQSAGLRRIAEPRGGNVSSVLQELIGEKIGELAREPELIAALDEAFRKLTIAVSPSRAGTVPVVVKVDTRTVDAPALEDIAVVEARRRGDQVAVELVGRGEFDGCRVLLVVAPAGRRVRFEVVPGDLSPTMETAS